MAQRPDPTPTETPNAWAPRPKRKRRTKLLIAAGSVLVLLLIVLALVPVIAGSLAPGIVRDALKDSINGKTDVGRVSLSWFGKQKIGPVVVQDASGRTLATLSIEASPGLLSLAAGGVGLSSLDLGDIKVSGSATITRGKDGKTNAEQVLSGGSSAPAKSGGTAKLPKGLAAHVVVDALDIRFIDESAAPGSNAAFIELRGVRMDASIARGNASLSLAAPAYYGATADAAASGGKLSVEAKVTNLTDAAGTIQPTLASIDLDLQARDLAVAVADALAGMDSRLIAAIGETLQASIKAQGKLSDGDAAISIKSRGLNTELAFKAADGVLTTTKPGTIALAGSGLLPLVPGAQESLKNQDDVKLDKMPDVTITLNTLSLPVPAAGKSPDLRAAAFVIDVATTEATGSVRVPAEGAAPVAPRAYRLAPLTARIDGHELAKQVTIKAETTATLDNTSAGKLAVDIAAMNLLDDAGALKAGLPPRIDGQVSLTGFMTAIAQPFLTGAGIDVTKDIGPQLDLVCKAATVGEGAASGDLPPTQFTLDLTSANIKAVARLLVEKRVLTTQDGAGVDIKVATLGPLASRKLKDAGVSVESGLGLAITASDVSWDVKGNDLRSSRATIKLETTQAKGKLAAPQQPVRAFDLAPVVATIDAKSLLRGVNLTAKTSVKLDGAPAGTLDLNLVASNLLTADGRARTSIPPLAGQLNIGAVSTAVIQPWVESSGLNLPEGVGPVMDIALTASPAGGAATAAELPRTDVTVTLKSANLNGSSQLTLDGSTLRTRSPGAEFTLKSPGTLAGKAAEKAGIKLSPGGSVKATIRSLTVALSGPPLDSAAADLDVTLAGLSIAPANYSAPTDALGLAQLTVTTKLAPGAVPSLELRGSGSQGSAQFTANGSLQVPGLFAKGADGKTQITPQNARPLGTIQITNLPTSLASFFIAPAAAGSMDTLRLIRDAVGPWATITFDAAARQNSPDARDINLTVAASKLNGGIKASVDDKLFSLAKLDFRTAIDPDLAGTLFELLGSHLESKPALSGPALIVVTAEPFNIPMKGLEPQLAQAGDASIKIGIEGKTLIKDLAFKDDTGQMRDIGVVGLQDIVLKAKVPLSALAQGAPAKPAEVTITGGVLGSSDQRIVDLNGSVKTSLASAQPTGDLTGSLTLAILDAKRLDTILNTPRLISGATGDTFNLTASAAGKFPPPGTAGTFDRAAIELSVTSPKITTARPLKATATGDRISLDSPMVLNWTVDQAWANAYLLAPAPPQPGRTPGSNNLQFSNSPVLAISVSQLIIATAKGAGPLKPGTFAADAEIKAPEVALVAGKSAGTLKGFVARVQGGREPGVVGFSMRADDLGSGPGPNNAPALLLQGGVYKIANDQGTLTTEAAVLTMSGDAYGMPSSLLDAIAQQGGMLAEALGPNVNLNIRTEGASATRGNIIAKAVSPRAELNLKGAIVGGTFVLNGPPEVATLKVITPELGRMLVDGLPLIGNIEKRTEDGPAIIRATGLKVPVDGQIKNLNGDVTIELGTARFGTSKFFGTIVRLVRQKDSGMIGRRLEPLTINFKDGVATYQRYKIPLGEFTVDTRGVVDLVNRRMDVVTYIPFGALTDEAAGKLNTGLGRLINGAVPLLEQATMVPFHTTGSFDNPETRADPELMIKEAGQTLLRPDQLIKRGIENIIKKPDK